MLQLNTNQSGNNINFGNKYSLLNDKMLQSFMNNLPCNNRENVNQVVPRQVHEVLDKFTRNTPGENEIKIVGLDIYDKGRQKGLELTTWFNDKLIKTKYSYPNGINSMTTPYDIAPSIEGALNSKGFNHEIKNIEEKDMMQNIDYKQYVSSTNSCTKAESISFRGNLTHTEKVGEALEKALVNAAIDGIKTWQPFTIFIGMNFRRLGGVNEKLLELANIIRANPDIDTNKLADILELAATKKK